MAILFFFVRHFLFLFFRVAYRLKVEGVENLPDGGAIIAANHLSFFDPPLIAAACPKMPHFLARKNLFDNPVFGLLISSLNAHPIGVNDSNLAVLRKMTQYLKEGEKVTLFPEGKRSPTGEIQPFLLGAALLASKSGCPIVPCAIQGTYEIWGKQRQFPLPWGRVIVSFGKPLYWTDYNQGTSKEGQIKMTHDLESSVRAMI
jgi:1-acyl-sn-glycerol-3-phosphate acyltransferase